jgi:hypothetical protein
LTFPSQSNSESSEISTSAGRIQGTATSYTGVSSSIFVNSVNDLFMYCYDLHDSVSNGMSVLYNINFGGVNSRTLDFLGAVNYKLNAADPYAWLRPTTVDQAAAIQLGIWESKYDSNSSWSLNNGAFKAENVSSDARGWFNDFASVIGTTASLDNNRAMVFESSRYQDMLAGDPPPNRVPEPGSLALLGLGLLGVTAVQRIRKS